MKISLVIFLFTFTIFFSSYTSIKGYKIIGTTTGIADSTLIFIEAADLSSSFKIDSTYIFDGKFQFSGPLKEPVVRVILRTKEDYKFLWLENSTIRFKAEKGKFNQATIIGSKTQNDQNLLDATIKETGKEKQQSVLFIRKHPNSIISASILSVYASTWGKNYSTTLYRNLSKENKNSPYGKDIFEFITLNKNIKVGSKYADFTELNTDGKQVSLSDFIGKVTLLEFWGSWCGGCRQGNPELVKIYNEFKNSGFEILGVAAEDKKETWLEAIRKDSLTWPNVTDFKYDKNKAAIIYGVSYYPTNFLIDKKGIIIARDLRGDDLRNKLHEILK